jgi:rhodanese-related sulfurtransferase
VSQKLKKALVVTLVVVGVVAFVAWRWSPEIHDAMLAKRPPASTAEIAAALERGALILDVRMERETRKQGAELVPGATNISLFVLERRLDSLPRDRPIVTFCVTGGRAGKAAEILRENGFEALSGGGVADVRAILVDTDPARRP